MSCTARDTKPELYLGFGGLGGRPALAVFHLWILDEVYSNADGSIQCIEVFTSSSGQGLAGDHDIKATSDGSTVTFPSDLSGSTTSQHLLIATPGFANLPGAVAPEYTVPCGPFFDPEATSITYRLRRGRRLDLLGLRLAHRRGEFSAGQRVDSVELPTNFAGTSGSLVLETCQETGACDACDDHRFCNGAESCAGSTGVGEDPCSGQVCDEDRDACVECVGGGDCDDDKP